MKRRSFIQTVLAACAAPFALVPRFTDHTRWAPMRETGLYVPSEWTHMVEIPGTGGLVRPMKEVGGHWVIGPPSKVRMGIPVQRWDEYYSRPETAGERAWAAPSDAFLEREREVVYDATQRIADEMRGEDFSNRPEVLVGVH